MQQIIVTFKRDGTVGIETKGFQGAACLKETAALEAALGLEKTSEERTPEFYQAVTQAAKVNQR